MIQPDAKCVVNGAKVNEAIMALNPLLAMSVGYIGGGKPPQVTYSDGEVKILLPLADSVDGFSLEELDIVDTDNAASSRYFMTSTGSVSTYGTTTASTSGTPTGKQSSAPPTSKDRNSLGNTPSNNNRDKLTTGGALRDPSGGVAPPVNVTGGALRDDRKVDQFGNTIGGSGALRDDGSTTAGGGINSLNKGNGIAGGMADDGQTAEQSRTNFLANQQRAADTTPAPLPGAPPLGGDNIPAPLPGAPPQGGDTTPPPTPGAPPLSGDEPTTRTPRPSSSMPMMAAGTDLSQSLPNKNGGVDMRTLGNMVAEGVASPYQEQFYNDAMSSAGGGDAGNAASDSTINDRFIQSEHDLYSENIKRIQQIVAQQGGDINVYLESFNRVFEAGYEERRRRFFDQAFKK